MGSLFIGYLQTDPRFFFAVVITVIVSITIHELAHGWMAIRHGDDTPLYNKQMTLNPLAHIPPFSWLLLAIAGIAWGRMYVDPTRMRGKYAEAWVALAGPASNIILAALGIVALGLWERFDPSTSATPPTVTNIKYLLMIFAQFNVVLAAFNMLPVPPLDGSAVLANLVPAYRKFLSGEMARGLMLAVFFGLFMGAGRYIFPWSLDLTTDALSRVSGHSAWHFIRMLG